MSTRYALVDAAGVVQNVVLWDGAAPWFAGPGLTLVADTQQVAGPGCKYINGAFVSPPPPPPTPPPVLTVSRMQAMVALSRAGLLQAVNNWVSQQDAETQLIWANAPTFSRNSTMLNAAAKALKLTDAQVTQLFATAVTILP